MADPARVAELAGRGFTQAQLLQVIASFDPTLVGAHFNDTKAILATKVEELERGDPAGRKAEDILSGGTPPLTPPTTPPSTPKKKGGKKKNKKGHHEGGLWHRLTHPRDEW